MKQCGNCGHANDGNAIFCGKCGAPITQAPPQPAAPVMQPAEGRYSTVAAGNYNTEGTAGHAQPPAGNAFAAQAVPPVKNSSTLWLVLNIVSLVLCCPGSLVFNVIGVILAAMGNSAFKAGDYAGSIARNRTAMVMFILGLVFGLAGIIAAFFVARAGLFG